MTLEQILEALRTRPRFAPQFTAWRAVPAVPATFAELPPGLDPRLEAALMGRGISRLYSHQAQAYHEVTRGGDMVVGTPTASGKTLCYNLPGLDSMLVEDDTRGRYRLRPKAR